jgi:hypothetical protein
MGIIGMLVCLCYVLVAWPMYSIAQNAKAPAPWRAWVPVWSLFLLLDVASLPAWLGAIALVLCFGAFAGNLAQLLAVFSIVIINVYLWARICARFGKNRLLALLILIPFVNWIFVVFLAISTREASAPRAAAKARAGFSHPERAAGEVLLGNYSTEAFMNTVAWKTKRLGVTAYDARGVPLTDPSLHPVFVQDGELRKAGVPR